jgi:hypothetical protein
MIYGMWEVLYDVGDDASRMSVRDKTIDAAIMLERSWGGDVPGRTSSRRRPGTGIRTRVPSGGPNGVQLKSSKDAEALTDKFGFMRLAVTKEI